MNTTGALKQAIVLVNQGDALAISDWVEIIRATRALLAERGELDIAVEYAVAVSRLVGVAERPNDTRHPLVGSLRGGQSTPASQLRAVVAMATHAARRNALTNPSAALLEGVERAALRQAPAPQQLGDLESALSRWISVVGAVGPRATPQVAAVIGRQQAALLLTTRHLVSKMTSAAAAEIDADRLLGQLDESLSHWRQAIAGWARSPEPVTVSTQDATALSMAAVELRDALTRRTATNETLAALLRSGVAGNLLVAAAVDQDPASTLVASADQLDAVASQAADTTIPIELVDNAADDITANRTAPHSTRPTAAVKYSTVEPPSVAAVELTPDLERELAARRDVGVVAQAALSGIPAAKGLLPHASVAELSALVSAGRQAVGTLVASVQPAIWSRVHRFRGEPDERFAVGAVAVTAAAHRWDPARSRWLSFAIQSTDWAQATYYKNRAGLPIPMNMNVDGQHRSEEFAINPRTLVSESPDPADIAVAATFGPRAAELVGQLP